MMNNAPDFHNHGKTVHLKSAGNRSLNLKLVSGGGVGMRATILATILVILAQVALGQTHRLSGAVVDSLTRKPVEFANVALENPVSLVVVNGTVSDINGKFSIPKLADGSYLVRVSFIGYQTKTFLITLRQTTDLGNIILPPSVKLLEALQVNGEKVLLEEKVDRSVYNAEQDATARGGDATDVLKRVPMLTVDTDGNVSLKGSTSVRVLINNKPSTMTAASVAEALRQIPSDMIKSVEVITSPSAKYDAEGSAGIINIILKKNNVPGVFLTTDASAGTRGSNAGLNFSYRQGKTGLSVGSFQRAQYNVLSDFHNEQTTRTATDTIVNAQTNHNRSNGYNSQYTLDFDYDISKTSSLTATGRYGFRNQLSYQDNLLTNRYEHNSLISSTLRNVKSTSVGYNFDGSLAYTKTFAKEKREFNFLGTYSRFVMDPGSGFLSVTQNATDQTVINRYRNDNTGYNQEINLQLDYQEPITANQLLEFGGKAVRRHVVSEYSYYVADGAAGPYLLSPSANLSSNFDYHQNINAGYLSYSFTTANNYAVKMGGRYEYTSIDAQIQGVSNLQIPSYGVLVPSVNVSRKLSNNRMIRASYNRRIVRPWLQALNPNLQASNALNATKGNPALKPEYADNYEIAYKTNIPKGTLNASLYSRYNTNDIQPARVIQHDTILAVYKNIGTEANIGTSLFASIDITESFSLNAGADLFYRILKNNSNDPALNATNNGLSQNYRLSGAYKFGKGWVVQFQSFMQGKNYNLQGYRTNVFSHSLSIKKDILNKAGSLALGLDNFATPAFNVYSNLQSTAITQYTITTIHNTIFKINFNYRIGKKLPERSERKKLTEEDD